MDNLSDQFEISGAESSEHDGKWEPKFDCEHEPEIEIVR